MPFNEIDSIFCSVSPCPIEVFSSPSECPIKFKKKIIISNFEITYTKTRWVYIKYQL